MLNATKSLSEEHQLILKVINALLKECENLEKTQKINIEFFQNTIDFIKNYADKYHHAKEEDFLFIEFCNHMKDMHCNPIEQMLYEHKLGRDFVKNLQEGLSENNIEKIIQNSKGYATLLQEHISKEDNVLYPMVNETLDDIKKQILIDEFEKIDQKFSEENKKYLSFANSLK